MPTHPTGVYLPTDDPELYESTELASAGWYDEGQHGGALAALVAGHVESVPTLSQMEIARISLEIFRVVPLVPLRLHAEVVREGKRIQTVRVDVSGPDGTVLSTALAQRLRTTMLDLPDQAEPGPLELPHPSDLEPPTGTDWGVGAAGRTMFHRQAIEIREAYGGFTELGPGAIWTRLTEPIVAGRPNSPAQRAAAGADFCNGISRLVDASGWVFMNSDLTVHLPRLPSGDWVGLEATSLYSPTGRGLSSGPLWDTRGPIGRSAQTLFLDRRA